MWVFGEAISLSCLSKKHCFYYFYTKHTALLYSYNNNLIGLTTALCQFPVLLYTPLTSVPCPEKRRWREL